MTDVVLFMSYDGTLVLRDGDSYTDCALRSEFVSGYRSWTSVRAAKGAHRRQIRSISQRSYFRASSLRAIEVAQGAPCGLIR